MMERQHKALNGKIFWMTNVILLSIYLVEASEDCLPDVGVSGNLDSVSLVIQTWETRMSNYHTSSPERLSSHSYTVAKSPKVSTIEGANIRFYGNQLCVAVKKMIERDPGDGGPSKITSACLKQCFGVGSGTRLDIYDGSGGRITSTNPPCCLWGRNKELRFSIPPPPTTPPAQYQCLECTGCGPNDPPSKSQTCNAGDKCFTLKLQRQKDADVTVVKGCSHNLRYWGDKLGYDFKCQSDVRISSEEYSRRYYNVCVSCCEGNKCNNKSNSATIIIGCNVTVVLLVVAQVIFKWL